MHGDKNAGREPITMPWLWVALVGIILIGVPLVPAAGDARCHDLPRPRLVLDLDPGRRGALGGVLLGLPVVLGPRGARGLERPGGRAGLALLPHR